MPRILAPLMIVAALALPSVAVAGTLEEPTRLSCERGRTPGPSILFPEVHRGLGPNLVYTVNERRSWRKTLGDPKEAFENGQLQFHAHLAYSWDGRVEGRLSVRSAPQKPYFAAVVSASANQLFTTTISTHFRTCRHGKPVTLGKPTVVTLAATEPPAGVSPEIPGEHVASPMIEGSFPYADAAATRLIKKGVLLVLSYRFYLEGSSSIAYSEQMALKLVSKHVPRT